MLAFWTTITDLGHSALLLPIAMVMALWLWVGGAWRVALLGVLALGLAIGMTSATKIIFFAWGIGIRALNFTGISGHTLMATAVFPVVATLIFMHRSSRVRRTAVTMGWTLALLIGASRYFIHVHSPTEIIAGWIVGASVAVLTLRALRQSPVPRLPPWSLLVVLLGLTFSLHAYGSKAEAHGFLIKLSMQLSGHNYVYVRLGLEGWHIITVPL